MQNQGFIIIGPTASGKSHLGLDAAQALGGAIINADSLQIYQGLPLLTAQPSQEDFRSIPHHLYGMLAPDQPCSVGYWLSLVQEKIFEIQGYGQVPLVVGGTGLYIQGLVEGLPIMPEVPASVRQEIRSRLEGEGPEYLYAELQHVDPLCAAKYAPQDTQRLTRALEVFHATGRPLSFWQQQPRAKLDWRWRVIVLLPDRTELEQKAYTRLHAMVAGGVVEEVEKLIKIYPDGGSLSRALGFQAFVDHLQNRLSLEQALQAAMLQTRQYIKRQYTWLRGQLKNPVIFNKIYHNTSWDEIKANFLAENAE